MNKKSAVLLLAFTFLISVIVFYSCSKSTAASKQETVQSLQDELYNSAEYTNFITATNDIIATLSVEGIRSADTKSSSALIGNKESFTKDEMKAILGKLNVNDAVYMKSEEAMNLAVNGFQTKYNLSNQQNALVWQQTIAAHKESFKASPQFPDIRGFIDCVITSVQEFAVTTAVCLALRKIPIIGQKLYMICETDAINNLIANLTGCLDYILP